MHLRKIVLWLIIATPCAAVADPIQVVPQPNNPPKFLGYQTSGVVSPVANYMFNGQPWYTSTMPLDFESAATLEAQGLENPFLNALSLAFPASTNWTFSYNTDAVLADNTFQLHTYQPQAPPPPASNDEDFRANNFRFYAGCVTNKSCTGAEFYTSYVPTGEDPTTNVHWIQLLYANYGTPMNQPTYEVDNFGAAFPYYPAHAANGSGFFDLPADNEPGREVFFDALLLLVTGPATNAPGPVTIYGGVSWGWSNQPVPEPGALALLIIGFSIAAAWRVRRI
jgi:PEP-CTERM motif